MPQWAWEFLRRRQDYRNRWNEFVRPFLNDGDGGFDIPAVQRHNRENASCALREGQQFHWVPPWEALRAEFRVFGVASYNSTLDPRLEQPPAFDGRSTTVVYVHAPVVGLPKVLFEFDLTLPVEPQLESARRELLRQAGQPSLSPRMQIDKFPRYLRLLDFKEAHTSNREIGDRLFPGSALGEPLRKSIRQNLEAAQHWQANYLSIALHPPPTA
jgi:hypothetical protein